MKVKVLSLLGLFLVIFFVNSAEAKVYSLSLRYQSVKEFLSLRQKFGSTLSIAPLKTSGRKNLILEFISQSEV